jgi:Flp pilus assembly protein TadD
MKLRTTFFVTGAGTSPRAEKATDEDRALAIERAVRHAASEAAHRMTPRRVRESIALDDTAPAFAEGMAMIDAGRFADARKIWEAALQTGATSAPLRYNLGAVCEALGDRRAAELHYNAARQLAPGQPRYADELKLFLRRTRP